MVSLFTFYLYCRLPHVCDFFFINDELRNWMILVSFATVSGILVVSIDNLIFTRWMSFVVFQMCPAIVFWFSGPWVIRRVNKELQRQKSVSNDLQASLRDMREVIRDPELFALFMKHLVKYV